MHKIWKDAVSAINVMMYQSASWMKGKVVKLCRKKWKWIACGGVFSLAARHNDFIHWRKHKHTVSMDTDVLKDYIVFSWNSVYFFYAEVTRTLRELHWWGFSVSEQLSSNKNVDEKDLYTKATPRLPAKGAEPRRLRDRERHSCCCWPNGGSPSAWCGGRCCSGWGAFYV